MLKEYKVLEMHKHAVSSWETILNGYAKERWVVARQIRVDNRPHEINLLLERDAA